ncbi:ATP-binding protein [Metapseudomonas otitidis]|uniref:hypothetical protein n=1 Tax=Metapseudomonas otitidis TaxID=319939 RepID=UPI0013F5B864
MEPSPSPSAGEPADPDQARLVDAASDCALRPLTPGDALGRPLADLFTGEDREAALPRIFAPFFTTNPLGKDTGLGLSQA